MCNGRRHEVINVRDLCSPIPLKRFPELLSTTSNSVNTIWGSVINPTRPLDLLNQGRFGGRYVLSATSYSTCRLQVHARSASSVDFEEYVDISTVDGGPFAAIFKVGLGKGGLSLFPRVLSLALTFEVAG